MVRKSGESDENALDLIRKIVDADQYGLLKPHRETRVRSTDEKLCQAFGEIVDFFMATGREPDASSVDIDERRLGARLEGLRMSEEKRESLADRDELNLLQEKPNQVSLDSLLGSDPSLDTNGLLNDDSGLLDMTGLPKLPRRQELKGEVAKRTRCEDFETFEPLFKQKHEELNNGLAKLVPFRGIGSIAPGAFFVLGGLVLFVADIGETEYQKDKTGEHRKRERLRLVLENGTESAMFRQSLAIRLAEGLGGQQIVPVEPEFELLSDVSTGWVYVLKSLSKSPKITGLAHLHKIGFTTRGISERVANASNEPTYLMAPVSVVAQYRTYNVKPAALEHLLHRIFADVRLDITQVGLDGENYDSTEWFQVPLMVIDQAVELITTGDIVDYVFDSELMKLRPRKGFSA